MDVINREKGKGWEASDGEETMAKAVGSSDDNALNVPQLVGRVSRSERAGVFPPEFGSQELSLHLLLRLFKREELYRHSAT
ncbi:hypothetical protein C0Q70_04888 [Pomacea canaliculata]|uniref:Uncharacterized protein n=1 Tax=Pomacea canaliculata TaxID=400727 RepID=A0A2T7PJP4_POMCA|nr:hypothetical protein C0Q70_04888 [Pomacea canaliculata]